MVSHEGLVAGLETLLAATHGGLVISWGFLVVLLEEILQIRRISHVSQGMVNRISSKSLMWELKIVNNLRKRFIWLLGSGVEGN